jgi:uncharacterized protein YbjT (DUF2867 family)
MSMFVIAGVTGHVGSVAAEELLAKGEKVKVIVRDAAKGTAWSKRGAEVATGSIEDVAFLTSALRGADGFFVLLPPNMAAPDFYGWQRKTGEGIAQAVKASGVPHVVLLSSVGADRPDKNGPIKGLHHLENALRAAGTKLTAVRAGYFQENIANLIGAAKGGGIYPSFGPADYAFPMIATRDIGKLVAAELLARPGKSEAIDLHGPSYSSRQLAEKLGARLGKPLQIVEIPPQGRLAALEQSGLPRQFAEAYDEMYEGFGSGAIVPKGDRAVQGKTEIDEVLKTLT